MNNTLPQWVWDIVAYLSDLVFHVRETADGIYEVWLIGVYLAIPFYTAADYIESVSNLFILADGTVGLIGVWILTLPSLSGVIEFLISYIPHFYTFVNDPIGFVQEFFASISEDFYAFVYYTSEWFTDHFANQAGWLRSFIDFPLSFILFQISTICGWFYNFLFVPWNYVASWVELYWPHINDVFENPLSWLQDLLAQFNTFIVLLAIDPYLFFNTCVAIALDISLADVLDFPRYLWNYLLDWVVDYVQDTSDRFVQASCDIIMLFI